MRTFLIALLIPIEITHNFVHTNGRGEWIYAPIIMAGLIMAFWQDVRDIQRKADK